MVFEALVLMKFDYTRKVLDKRSYKRAKKRNDHFNRTSWSDNKWVITYSIFESTKRRYERYIAYIALHSTTRFNGNNTVLFRQSVFLIFIWLAKPPLFVFPKKQLLFQRRSLFSVEVRIKLLYTFYTNLSPQTANKLRIFIMILQTLCNIHAVINLVVISTGNYVNREWKTEISW
jgi:hypothetical protein